MAHRRVPRRGGLGPLQIHPCRQVVGLQRDGLPKVLDAFVESAFLCEQDPEIAVGIRPRRAQRQGRTVVRTGLVSMDGKILTEELALFMEAGHDRLLSDIESNRDILESAVKHARLL